MIRWLLLLVLLTLSACSLPIPNAASDSLPQNTVSTPMEKTPPATLARLAAKDDLPDLGPAPELAGEVWLNTNAPLRLADLRGRVILVDMWTFG